MAGFRSTRVPSKTVSTASLSLITASVASAHSTQLHHFSPQLILFPAFLTIAKMSAPPPPSQRIESVQTCVDYDDLPIKMLIDHCFANVSRVCKYPTVHSLCFIAPQPPAFRTHTHKIAPQKSAGKRLGIETPSALKTLLADIGLETILDRTARHIARHPCLTFVLATVFLCMALPFVLFLLFACVTVAITFTGFVLVEGTLITVASMLLFACICGLFAVGISVAAAALTAYVACTFVMETLWPNRMYQQRQRTAEHREHSMKNGLRRSTEAT